MHRRQRTVYVVYGEGEGALAEELVLPLSDAGYHVVHHGTVAVGKSLVGEAAKALASNSPIVLCATVRAVGTAWPHLIVRAAQVDGHMRVFVVQMEEQAFVEQLTFKAKVAQYWEDPARVIRDLLDALAKHFPPQIEAAAPAQKETLADGRQFLDQPTESAAFDFDALGRFRSQLREEIIEQFPAALTAWEFLDRAGLRSGSRLTRTGALLFAGNLVETNPTAMVKCTQYRGSDRAAERDTVTFTGTVPDQIIDAREFVAVRVRAGEAPSADQAQSAMIYDYPMVAVREIIANALVHRDYMVTDKCVHVRLFPDRLEVSSPGDWLGGDVADGVEHNLADLAGQSIKRNFRLAHILSWIRLVEGEGSGIPAALHDCRVSHSLEPKVMQAQGFVTVTLRRREPAPMQLQVGQWQALVPMSIPADIAYYTGREDERAKLDTLLPDAAGDETPRTRIGVITGMPGVGKSALALHWAHHVRDQFPDGQLYVDLRGVGPGRPPATPAEAVRGFVAALGVPSEQIPTDLDGLVGLYRSLLHDRSVLVLLDDADSADQVRPLLPGGSACTVLITSRNRMSSLVARDGARPLHLDLLIDREAREFLVRRLGQDRVETEPAAADALIERCAGLPLALAIVAARAAYNPGFPLSALAEELLNADDRLSRLSLEEDPGISVRTVFSSSYGALTLETARVFRLLGVHPGPDIASDVAVSLAGLPPPEARQSLVELVRQNLLDEHVPGRYRFHSLLREYAVERVAVEEPEHFVSMVMSRIAAYYLHTGISAARFLNPHRETITVAAFSFQITLSSIDSYEQAIGWFTAEETALLAVIDQVARLWPDLRAWQLAWVLAPFLDLQSDWHALIVSQRTALAAAERAADPAAQAISHRFLGRAYNRMDSDDDAVAHHQRALTLFRQLGDRTGQANTLYDLAEIRELQGRHGGALDNAQEALEQYMAIGDSSGARDADELVRRNPEKGRVSRPPRPLAMHRTIIILDIVGFGDPRRTDTDQLAVRQGLYRVLGDAFAHSDIPLDLCYLEDRGDGVFIAAPSEIPKIGFVENLPRELVRELREHNRASSAATSIRLRMAVHAGEIHYDEHGAAGVSINLAFRLIESAGFKSALLSSDSPLAFITSEWFFDEVVRHSRVIDPAEFHPTRVSVKETSIKAWIYLPSDP